MSLSRYFLHVPAGPKRSIEGRIAGRFASGRDGCNRHDDPKLLNFSASCAFVVWAIWKTLEHKSAKRVAVQEGRGVKSGRRCCDRPRQILDGTRHNFDSSLEQNTMTVEPPTPNRICWYCNRPIERHQDQVRLIHQTTRGHSSLFVHRHCSETTKTSWTVKNMSNTARIPCVTCGQDILPREEYDTGGLFTSRPQHLLCSYNTKHATKAEPNANQNRAVDRKPFSVGTLFLYGFYLLCAFGLIAAVIRGCGHHDNAYWEQMDREDRAIEKWPH